MNEAQATARIHDIQEAQGIPRRLSEDEKREKLRLMIEDHVGPINWNATNGKSGESEAVRTIRRWQDEGLIEPIPANE